MSVHPLNNLYDDFVEIPSDKKLNLLIKETLNYLNLQFKPRQLRLESGEAISEALEAIYSRVKRPKLPKINNYSSYVFTTANNKIRQGFKARGIAGEKIVMEEKHLQVKDDQIDVKVSPISPYIKMVITGVSLGKFTPMEMKIITLCLREYKALLENEEVDFSKAEKAKKRVKKTVREKLSLNGPTFCNHMRRIKNSLRALNRVAFPVDSVSESIHFLTKKGREFKTRGLKEGKEQDFISAILCYEVVNYLEPRFWLKISSSTLKDLIPKFWEAKYNIGFCHMRVGERECALKVFGDFSISLEKIAGKIHNQTIIVEGGTYLNENSVYIDEVFMLPNRKNDVGLGLDIYFLSKVYNQIGNIYEENGDNTNAISFFRKAEYVDPKDIVVKFNLFVNYALTGNEQSAKDIYNNFKDNPRFSYLLANLDHNYTFNWIAS